jgi:uncharacterized OB-fold protein/acyl dehydratase
VTPEELRSRLEAWIGREGEPLRARDPVNQPMIRHWCDAVEDANPVYTDPEFAQASVHGGIVAPPTMLQAWTMPGLPGRPVAPPERPSPLGEVLGLLDGEGYTSVVATNCRQEYRRYLRVGDALSVTSRVVSVSDEKKTALGVGRFVDVEMIYRDGAGEEVARMTFRILKFRPPSQQGVKSPSPSGPAREARRPRPATSRDNAFFWEGVAAGELRIQRCTSCKMLRHPPGPMCPSCQSLDWDAVVASGRGRVYSYVVAHHPPVPPFTYPNAIALIALEEGTRLVSNVVGIDPADLTIGLPVEVEFTRVDEELVLPLFRPVAAKG